VRGGDAVLECRQDTLDIAQQTFEKVRRRRLRPVGDDRRRFAAQHPARRAIAQLPEAVGGDDIHARRLAQRQRSAQGGGKHRRIEVGREQRVEARHLQPG